MANHLETRMARIEVEMDRQYPVSHHRVVQRVPIDEPDINAYLRGVQCPCGQPACELKTFGLVVPQPLSSAAWQHQAQEFYRERFDHA